MVEAHRGASRRKGRFNPLELLLVVDDLDAMLIILFARLGADGGKVSVHDESWSGLGSGGRKGGAERRGIW